MVCCRGGCCRVVCYRKIPLQLWKGISAVYLGSLSITKNNTGCRAPIHILPHLIHKNYGTLFWSAQPQAATLRFKGLSSWSLPHGELGWQDCRKCRTECTEQVYRERTGTQCPTARKTVSIFNSWLVYTMTGKPPFIPAFPFYREGAPYRPSEHWKE